MWWYFYQASPGQYKYPISCLLAGLKDLPRVDHSLKGKGLKYHENNVIAREYSRLYPTRDATARSRLRANTGALFCNTSEMKPCKVPPLSTKGTCITVQIIYNSARLPEIYSSCTPTCYQDPNTDLSKTMADSPTKFPPSFPFNITWLLIIMMADWTGHHKSDAKTGKRENH